jgi:hypothetical protein
MMKVYLFLLVALIVAGCGDDNNPTTPTGRTTSFFVTSATSVTGNLGGLAGADATCQRLASAAGHTAGTWRAYLSVERDPANGNQPTHARDRMGPNQNTAGALSSWNSAHASLNCADTAPRGGAGRFYCFAR